MEAISLKLKRRLCERINDLNEGLRSKEMPGHMQQAALKEIEGIERRIGKTKNNHVHPIFQDVLKRFDDAQQMHFRTADMQQVARATEMAAQGKEPEALRSLPVQMPRGPYDNA